MENNTRIYWEYNQYKPMVKGNLQIEELREVTTCVIETNDQVVSESVRQYYKDVPNRKLARRESFKRAVSQIPSREERKLLWSVFNEKFPKCLNCK